MSGTREQQPKRPIQNASVLRAIAFGERLKAQKMRFQPVAILKCDCPAGVLSNVITSTDAKLITPSAHQFNKMTGCCLLKQNQQAWQIE
jgi:hypothetical protein